MNQDLPQVLSATLDTLVQFAQENLQPEAAQSRLRQLQAQYPAISMELVWELEGYGNAVHYDVLLRASDAGTISLGFCPDRIIPWALRHANHSRESEIVRVNGRVVTVQEVMTYLDFIWDDANTIGQLVDSRLLQKAIEEREIKATDEELQAAMNAFRRKHRLFSAAEMMRWMEEHGTNQEKLEHLLAGEVAITKLRDEIAAGTETDYFQAHRTDFDVARVARIKLETGEQAQQLIQAIRSGNLDFFSAAAQQFQAGKGDGKLFALLRRQQLSARQANVIFSATPGEVVDPIPSGDGYELVQLLELNRAELDESTREAVKDALFKEWLKEQREAASVEWFWGDIQRLSQVTAAA